MTPLLLVVGFLGAGKTTFLKQLAPALAERGIRPALLLNDYQNARVDAEQFRELIDEVRALSGDCVCCGSREQFFDELRAFRHEPERVMLVEANGTTEPGPLIEALALDRTLAGFAPPVQLTVIDVQRWQKRFWHNRLEREQARMATHLSLSRAERVAPARLEEVMASLSHTAPRGRITTPEELASRLLAMPHPHEKHVHGSSCCGGEHSCGHQHQHAEHSAESHFASCEFALPSLVDDGAFKRLLRDLPQEVLRAKGVVRFASQPGEFFVVQKVDREVQFLPVGPNPRLAEPLLLCIGPRLDEAEIERRIAALAEGTTS